MGGFVEDIFDGIGDILEDVGDFIGDTVDAVVHNPVGAIVDIGLLYMGVPPVWAGAAAGAAGAAASGGDILKGALTGGAMAGIAGYASEWAGAQGLGTVGQAAAAGAAAGATGAALTGQGMGYVVKGALSGGIMGGAVGYIQKPNGSITYTYDDGSTLTRNADGSYSSTPSGSIPAPVVDKSTYSTTKMNLSSSWPITVDAPPGTIWTGDAGPEIVLNGGKVLPMDVYRAAVAQGGPIFVDGVQIDPSLSSYAQSQGNFYDQSKVIEQYRAPGTALATAEQINTGKAVWNPQAHAWETTLINDVNNSSVFSPRSLTSTGISDSAPGTIYNGPNGPEIVLDSGKTVNLTEYQNAVDSGQAISIDGQIQTRLPADAKARIDSIANEYFKNPTDAQWDQTRQQMNAVIEEQIQNGVLKPIGNGVYSDPDGILWKMNSSTGMWDTPNVGEVPTAGAGGAEPVPDVSGAGQSGQPTGPVAPTTVGTHPEVVPNEIITNPEHVEVDQGQGWVAYNPDGSSYGVDENGVSFQHGAGSFSEGGGEGPEGGKTITYDDGSTITIHNDGSVTSTPATDGGQGGGAGGPGPVNPNESVMPSPDEDFPPTQDTTPPVDETEFPHDRGEPAPDVTEPVEPTEPPVTNPPIVPIVPPITPKPEPEYTLNWGNTGAQYNLNTNQGLNPGWIQPVKQYQTTSPVQSQYHWGAAPFQAGQTFNPALAAQGVSASPTPWGLQQMFQPMTPEQTAALVQQQSYLNQLPGAHVAGPVAPY